MRHWVMCVRDSKRTTQHRFSHWLKQRVTTRVCSRSNGALKLLGGNQNLLGILDDLLQSLNVSVFEKACTRLQAWLRKP